MTKYKYYFHKPRSAITKDIIQLIAIAGVFTIAATSPYSGVAFWKAFQNKQKYPKRKVADTFTRLLRNGLIEIQKEGYDVKIALTPEGKEVAGYMQIDALSIKRPNRWDGSWRIILFDISNLKTIHRNAFRGKVKSLGFLPLQKSVWVHPFDCRAEVELLCDFFGLSKKEVILIETRTIGDDNIFKRHFKL